MTQYQTAALFGKAFVSAATMNSVINAFRATGIWPLNKDIFTDADFAPADLTDNSELVQDEEALQGDNIPLTQKLLNVEPGEKTPPRQPTPTR